MPDTNSSARPSARQGAAASIAFVLAGLLSGTSPAGAADLARRARPPPIRRCPHPLPVFTWTGPYVGVNAGDDLGRSGGFTDGTMTSSARPGGVAGGVPIGHNDGLMRGDGVVVGLEADIQGTAFAEADATYLGTAPHDSVRPHRDGSGSVHARVGYAFDRVRIYGAGGFAYGEGSAARYAAPAPDARSDTTRPVHTVGAAAEWALTGKLTAKLEALRLGLGRDGDPAATDTAVPAYYGTAARDAASALIRAGLNDRS